ncbi:MAG: VOC family protein [Deltaproteobacteria bacterium]|nr:VOC family protein [Deltaproteobacteria bacterium]
MTDRIAIVSVPVTDQARAKAFYTETLGFDVVRDNPMGPDQQWIELLPNGGGVSITLVTWFEALAAGGQQGLVLGTGDIDARRAELVARGLEISEVQAQPWGRFATFRDPDGNGWVLTQTPTPTRAQP